MERKLFKAVKTCEPEWGAGERIWTKYFIAGKKETVEEILRSRYGGLSEWSDYNRAEYEITVTEVECEEL